MMIGGAPFTRKTTTDRDAILAGQHEVQHDQVGMNAGEFCIHLAGIRRGLERETLFQEEVAEEIPDSGIVVDKQEERLRNGHTVSICR
jgi:hypothetical protein